jgi:hypothetical protein
MQHVMDHGERWDAQENKGKKGMYHVKPSKANTGSLMISNVKYLRETPALDSKCNAKQQHGCSA